MMNTKTRKLVWAASVGMMALFCGYNLHNTVHRFDGIVGMTRKNGIGCKCHNIDPTPSVQVWIDGPDTLQPGETGVFTLSIVGDSTRTAGFNIATAFGLLEVVDSAGTYWYEDEMTHISPKPADGTDTVSWEFAYVAPDTGGPLVDTLYSVANSTNQDTMATDADHWNFGGDFLVTVMNLTGVDVSGNFGIPSGIVVHQNYPNPFNPVTTIIFDLPANSLVDVSLFDVTGRFIATIGDGVFHAGTHQLVVDANRHNLSSGVYFYRLEAHSLDGRSTAFAAKKMALVK